MKKGMCRNKTVVQGAACVLGGIALWGILTAAQAFGLREEANVLLRDDYGGDETAYDLVVEGIETEPLPITVQVGARTYTKEEAQAVFSRLKEQLKTEILGDNPSLSQVQSDLKLPSRAEGQGVRLQWSSSKPELLDASGVLQSVPVSQEGETVVLQVQMRAGEFSWETEYPVRVIPKPLTEEEKNLAGLMKEIQAQEEKQRKEAAVQLPGEYEGRPLKYYPAETASYGMIPILGILLAALLYARDQSDERERKKKRERELLLDYSELLSRLMVFLGAGLTVRSAWGRITEDYERRVAAGSRRKRAAYEEMSRTWNQLQHGMPERNAFREFGSRCRLPPYLKLSGLLEQDRKNGGKNLREILQAELEDAFEERKNLARRLGEEAGTKLLVPLFLLMGIVMVMIMVPAMMSMG